MKLVCCKTELKMMLLAVLYSSCHCTAFFYLGEIALIQQKANYSSKALNSAHSSYILVGEVSAYSTDS